MREQIANRELARDPRIGELQLGDVLRDAIVPPELALVGDAWLKDGTSAVLEVPNAIIPDESNYLLNPRHAGFATITIGRPQPFEFDLRLLR